MVARLSFGMVIAFWLTMNVLLWQEEFGAHEDLAEVPVALVWRKILTAPDASSLSIWHRGQRIGFGHWSTSVGEELAELDEALPDGGAERIKNYRLKLDGNVALPGDATRLRFDCAITLSTNHLWQEFALRLAARPTVWELRSVAAEQTLRFHSEDGHLETDRVFRFADLQQPQALLAEFAGPAGLGFLAALGMPPITTGSSSRVGLRWQAGMASLIIGREPVRVFRLQTRVLDRFNVRVFVSRAGEILRVELPNDVILKNDQINLPETVPP